MTEGKGGDEGWEVAQGLVSCGEDLSFYPKCGGSHGSVLSNLGVHRLPLAAVGGTDGGLRPELGD